MNIDNLTFWQNFCLAMEGIEDLARWSEMRVENVGCDEVVVHFAMLAVKETHGIRRRAWRDLAVAADIELHCRPPQPSENGLRR